MAGLSGGLGGATHVKMEAQEVTNTYLNRMFPVNSSANLYTLTWSSQLILEFISHYKRAIQRVGIY